ncbi:MAG: transglycosylase domain-containing protein [Bacteroidales bacterium]
MRNFAAIKIRPALKKISPHILIRLKKFSIYFLALIPVILAAALIFRHPITGALLNRKINRFNEHYQAKLAIGSFSFNGVTGISFNKISLKPADGDTLIKIGYLHANINFWKLFRFRLSLENLEMKDALFRLIRHDSITNYMFLVDAGKKTAVNESDSIQPTDFANRADRLLSAMFNQIPSTITINNLRISADLNSNCFGFYLPQLAITDHEFETTIEEIDNGKITPWILRGNLDAGERSAGFKIFAGNHEQIVLPYISQRLDTHIGFDTLRFSLTGTSPVDDVVTLTGVASLSNLVVNQPRISSEDVVFGKGLVDYKINIGTDYIELDSTSRFIFNKIEANPYIRYKAQPTKQITLILNKPEFAAADFFESLPKGLFSNLDGLKTSGDLSFYFKFMVDLSKPDSLYFSTGLERKHFRIVSYGNTNLSKMSEPFEYTAYERGVPVRTFEVGPANPNFRPLDAIPAYLKDAIMTSEDGQFFNHRGFLPDAFRQSIITNIRQHRFARGGSTISMQLIKNVFLNRNKTITRKLEEALIVWLIENNGLTTKERMYEVYLNIIEMGPMVYGVNEAARFYFDKDVSKLTLAEAIYLASIVPHPKWFKYSFDEEGQLRDFLASYYKLMSEKMLHKELITQEDFDALQPKVELKGIAKTLVLPADSIPPDSLSVDFIDELQLP